MANFEAITVTDKRDGKRVMIPVAGIMAVEEYKGDGAFVVMEAKKNGVIGIHTEESFITIERQLPKDFLYSDLYNGNRIMIRPEAIAAIFESKDGKAGIRYKGMGYSLRLRDSFDCYAGPFAEREIVLGTRK